MNCWWRIKILETFQHFMSSWRTPHPLGSSCDDSWQAECFPQAMYSKGRPCNHWRSCERPRCQIRFRSWFIFPRVQKKSKINQEMHTLMLSMHSTGNGTCYALRFSRKGIKFILKGKKSWRDILLMHSLLWGVLCLVWETFIFSRRSLDLLENIRPLQNGLLWSGKKSLLHLLAGIPWITKYSPNVRKIHNL